MREYAGQGKEAAEAVVLETNQNVLADLTEALIGALYLAFGFDAVRPAVVELFNEHIRYAVNSYIDYKTELQEYLARDGRTVAYEVLDSTGPAHEREFRVEARVGGQALGSGSGSSKKRAEQAAAREALRELRSQERRRTQPRSRRKARGDEAV